MKLAPIVTLASLAVCAFAQRIEIGYPPNGMGIKPGKNLTVQVVRPDSLTGSEEISLKISLKECPKDGHCPDPAKHPGTTLYSGVFNPKFPTSSTTPNQAPQQNFTVIVPNYLKANRTAKLYVTHHAIYGASDTHLMEIKNVTLKVVPDS